jgi:hypothetical protein
VLTFAKPVPQENFVVLLFPDNARTHTSARTAEAITNFVRILLPHDSFNDAVSISDYVAWNGGKVSSLIK